MLAFFSCFSNFKCQAGSSISLSNFLIEKENKEVDLVFAQISTTKRRNQERRGEPKRKSLVGGQCITSTTGKKPRKRVSKRKEKTVESFRKLFKQNGWTKRSSEREDFSKKKLLKREKWDLLHFRATIGFFTTQKLNFYHFYVISTR